MVNLDAFHSLLAKFLEFSSLPGMNLMSLPGVLPVHSMNLRASAPTWSIISRGSMPLPRDLLILRPCSSLTRPWRNTYSNGASPVTSRAEKAILMTQKKSMSYPVTITDVG